MKDSFFCLVVGSRSFNDYDLMKTKLDNLLSQQEDVTIVSGGAKGADSLAEKYARENNFDLKVFPAKWKEYGRSAGFIRNEEMHKFISQKEKRGVVAFWDGESKGTEHSFSLAKKYNNDLRVVRFSP